MKKSSGFLFQIVIFLLLSISACNVPISSTPTTVGPTLVPSLVPTLVPTQVPKNGITMTYTDLSTLVFDQGGQVTGPDGANHNVDPFWLYRSPVTNGQYALCVASGACTPPAHQANPNFVNPSFNGLPVDGVNVDQAQAYCAWMGGSLPTDLQFQKINTDFKLGSALLPPSPCTGQSKCSPPSGYTAEFVGNPANTLQTGQSVGNPGVIILQAGGIILQAGGIILQRGGIILQNQGGIILQDGAGGIILQNNNGSAAQAQPMMEVFNIKNGVQVGGLNFRCVINHPLPALAPMCSFVRSANSNFPPFVCPQPGPSIDVKGSYCSNGQAFFTVDVHNASSYQVDQVTNGGTPGVQLNDQTQNCTVDAADSTSDTTRLICSGKSDSNMTVTAYEQCAPPAGWNPKNPCLYGYHYNPATNMCDYGASSTGPTQVPSGPTLVPGGPTNYPPPGGVITPAAMPNNGLCPSGFTLSPIGCCAPAKSYPAVCPPGDVLSGSQCLPYSQIVHVVHQDVNVPECATSSGGNSGGGGCNLTCAKGEELDAKTCSCYVPKP